MRLALAQIHPQAGDIAANLVHHHRWAEQAAAAGADLVLFPELSLTGYEPRLAGALALDPAAARLAPLQALSDRHRLWIGLGLPLRQGAGVVIGLLLLGPGQAPRAYAKQLLHPDEEAWFVPGTGAHALLDLPGLRLAPAICYESLQPAHAEAAVHQGAQLYAVSAAKPARNLARAQAYFPDLARQQGLPVCLCNAVGPCDDFVSAGGSSAWDAQGRLQGQLDAQEEALLLFDTRSQTAVAWRPGAV